jgi:hypothetical protein
MIAYRASASRLIGLTENSREVQRYGEFLTAAQREQANNAHAAAAEEVAQMIRFAHTRQ